MGIIYFVMNTFAQLFFGNETRYDYDLMDNVYDYEESNYDNDYNDDTWFHGNKEYLV